MVTVRGFTQFLRSLGDGVVRPRHVDELAQRSSGKLPLHRQLNSLPGDLQIFLAEIGSRSPALVHDGSAQGGCHSGIRVNHQVTLVRESEYQPFYEFDWELARVLRFLYVVVLHVRYHPHVAGILAQWVAGVLALLRAFERLLARILLRYSDRIEIEHVVVALGEPHDVLVATGQAVLAVQPVLEAPDDAVAELHAQLFADLIDEDVDGENLAIRGHVVADLPTDTSVVGQRPVSSLQRLFLLLQIFLELLSLLVFLADVVGWGRYDEPGSTFRNLLEQFQSVTVEQRCLSF